MGVSLGWYKLGWCAGEGGGGKRIRGGYIKKIKGFLFLYDCL